MKLFHNGKPTAKLRALERAYNADDRGIEIMRTARGFSDYIILRELVLEGLLQIRANGPRGGIRYHITDAGRDKIYLFENSEARK